jgi:hypothetical protein
LLDAIKVDKSDGDLQLNAPIQHSLSDSGKQLPLVDLDKILIQL